MIHSIESNSDGRKRAGTKGKGLVRQGGTQCGKRVPDAWHCRGEVLTTGMAHVRAVWRGGVVASVNMPRVAMGASESEGHVPRTKAITQCLHNIV